MKIHVTAILQCLTLSIVQDISFGTKYRYKMLWWVYKHTIGCGTVHVLWFVTLQVHTCTLHNYVDANAMESFAKLNKLELSIVNLTKF